MTLRKSASAFGRVVVAFERMTFGAEEYDAACDRQMEFWLDVIRQKKKGRPDGQPFHCRAVVRLNCCDNAAIRRRRAP